MTDIQKEELKRELFQRFLGLSPKEALEQFQRLSGLGIEQEATSLSLDEAQYIVESEKIGAIWNWIETKIEETEKRAKDRSVRVFEDSLDKDDPLEHFRYWTYDAKYGDESNLTDSK